jgi:hypothetical protein
VKAAILLVGEDEVLSYTRAQILSDLGVVVADPIEAPQLLRANAFDLLVFCQTVKDSTAKEIIA